MSTRPIEEAGDREDFLRELLLGERDPDDPDVRARLEADSELRERWEAERDLSDLLDGAGALEDDVLAELGEGAPAPGEERIAETLAGLAPRRPGATSSNWWRPWFTAAAALLLVALGWMWRSGDEEEWLGDATERPQLEAPRGRVDADALGVFRWSYLAPDGWRGSCSVRIVVDGSPLPWQPLVREHDEDGGWEWRPTSDQVSELVSAAGFVWEVEAGDVGEEPVLSERASVSLSP